MPTGPRRAVWRGFTLIEVLIVVTIIAILTSIIIPHIGSMTDKARAQVLLSDLQMIRTRLIAYNAEHNGQYPLVTEMWDNLTGQTDANGNAGGGLGPYLLKPPVNPFSGGWVCAADNSADWEFDEVNGTIRGVVPVGFITKLQLSPTDVVAKP